jgi:hypothetical protein
LYCGLTGKYPFDGPHATAIITAHVTRDVPTFGALAPNVRIPDGLENVVRRCLEKKPGRRYPSMDALIADLIPYHSGSPLEGVSGEFHTLTAGQVVVQKRDWTAVWAGIVVGGVIAVLLAMLIATAVIGFRMRAETQPTAVDVAAEQAEATEPATSPPVTQPAVAQPPVVEPPAAESPTQRAAPARRSVKRTSPRRVAQPAERPEPPARSKPVTPPPEEPKPETAGDWSDVDLEGVENPWD